MVGRSDVTSAWWVTLPDRSASEMKVAARIVMIFPLSFVYSFEFVLYTRYISILGQNYHYSRQKLEPELGQESMVYYKFKKFVGNYNKYPKNLMTLLTFVSFSRSLFCHESIYCGYFFRSYYLSNRTLKGKIKCVLFCAILSGKL